MNQAFDKKYALKDLGNALSTLKNIKNTIKNKKMMPTQMDGLKNILVNAFLQMYQHYQADDIYACCLTLDEFLLVEDLTLSTEKSIFSDQEDRMQYLAEKDRWNVQKWRYRSTNSSEHGLKQFRNILLEYFQSQQFHLLIELSHQYKPKEQ